MNNKGHRKEKRLGEGRVAKVILVILTASGYSQEKQGISGWSLLAALVTKGLITISPRLFE